MTKKDYELIANTLWGEAYSEPGILCEAWEYMDNEYAEMVEALAYRFEQNNPKFNRSKFLQACGLES